MKRYIINSCYGGFNLSQEAFKWLVQNKGWTQTEDIKNKEADLMIYADGIYIFQKFNHYDLALRSHPDILSCVDSMGLEAAGGRYSQLEIVTVKSSEGHLILEEYDGIEELIRVIS